MNQGVVFVLASAVLLASVAGAHVFAPLPDGTSSRGSVKAASTSGQIQSYQLSAKPVVETRQAPVPLVMRERPPVALPPALETVAARTPAQSATSNGEGGNFAKGAIEADGYKFVKTIAPGPDGTWRARALRGKTEVVVTVDREGRVSAD
jgi:hypothetical protein